MNKYIFYATDIFPIREYIDEGIVYVALEMRASTRFSNVPVGRNYIIFPDATVNEVEKYIILTMTTETHLKWRNELAEHYPFVLRGEKIDRQGRIKLWENHKRRESMSYDVCRERIEKELGEIKFKQERADRRRAAASSSYLEDPNDSITFVVYPIEPEVPVSNIDKKILPCLFIYSLFLLFASNYFYNNFILLRCSINFCRMQ